MYDALRFISKYYTVTNGSAVEKKWKSEHRRYARYILYRRASDHPQLVSAETVSRDACNREMCCKWQRTVVRYYATIISAVLAY